MADADPESFTLPDLAKNEALIAALRHALEDDGDPGPSPLPA